MRDSISQQRANHLHPKVRQEVIDLIEKVEANMPPNEMIRIVQGVRTIEEQDELYAQGRTKPGNIVTKARGGSSNHNYHVAFDYARMKDGKVIWEKYQPMVDTFIGAGWVWGGNFKTIKDMPHFEKTFGHTIKKFQAMYKAKQFIPGTTYLAL